MDERPFPHGPLPQPPPSRRGFLIVGGLAVVAAGGGVWWALSDDGAKSAAVPTALIDQLDAARTSEYALIVAVQVALKHPGPRAAALRQLHADHVDHATAIEALIADEMYPAKATRAPVSVYVPKGRIPIAQVRLDESGAARAAAARAAKLPGRAAVLLASIAACEATHAELLK
jgi:hypothetical protein